MTRVLSAAILMLAFVVPARADKVDCEPARCAGQSQIDAQCPACDAADNHGRYVSCVAHIVKRAVADGTVPVNCKGKVVRCAARSTCGKPGFVRCLFPIDTCVIDPISGLGTCGANPEQACVVDLDCGSKCKTKSSSERCTTRGGFDAGSGSCCPGCGGGSPSGAFVH